MKKMETSAMSSDLSATKARSVLPDSDSRFGIVLNGSPLFTGGAGSGESEIRRFVLENDLLEAIIGLPTDMFYNTGISTYVWIVTNRKPAHRKGKLQRIDASGFWQKMRKSLGSKRRELSEDHIAEITRLFGECKEVSIDPETRKPISRKALSMDEQQVERSAAMKCLMGWVRLYPYNIAQKVQIVVGHYWLTAAPLLNGKGKAMVVVSRRPEAVHWQLAIDSYIKEMDYPLRTLVAFSGEVNDKKSRPEPFKESSKELNPNLKGRDIRKAFDGDEFQILLVANKFQTGFDQPMLCGMYVDKRLAGIQAVKTLSWLNRCHPGKDKTFVLDFVNDPEEVLNAFSHCSCRMRAPETLLQKSILITL